MEPNHNQFNGASELPQPRDNSSEQSPETYQTVAPEVQTGMPVSGVPPAPMQAAQPVQQPATDPLATPVPPTMSQAQTGHLIADDADLIEKEWVNKAKAIVAGTKDDPHRQNEEMTKVKADYLKKRYNKDLKLSEG